MTVGLPNLYCIDSKMDPAYCVELYLSGLVEEDLLHILQLQGPLVDVLLQLPEQFTVDTSLHSSGKGPNQFSFVSVDLSIFCILILIF